jgi:hypothetical protein
MIFSFGRGNLVRGNTVIFLGVGVLGLPLLMSCGSGLCISQTSCSSGSGSSVPGAGGGVLGSFADFMASMLHRDKTSAQVTLKAELAQGVAALPAGYRKVPRIGNDILPTAGDDEGYTGGSVTYALRPATSCGTNQSTVAARIADCAAQNPTRSTWDGPTNGNAGQGVWKLVTYNSTHEVWRDERTTLLWSDRLGTTNWCRASGSSGGGPFAEVDQYNYCDNVANQNQVTPESWCTEDPGLDTPGAYDSMKGGMRFAATGTSPSVVWRLPTIYDYQMASIDGIRFTLPNMVFLFWSASVYSFNRIFAWYFGGDVGTFSLVTRVNGGYSVRCVGR